MMLFLVLRKKRNIYNQQIEEIDKSKKRASDWNREMAYWEFSRDYAEYKNAYDSYNKCCSKIKEYQEEFLEGKLLREKIQDIQLSEKSSNKCKCDARRHLLHKAFPDDLAISTDISISKQDCVDHLCGFINLKEKIKQKLIDENNDLSLRLAKNLVVKDYMEKHINVEPWELELVENLKDSMKSVKLTFECNGRTVEGRVLVASLLLNLNCGYDFDLYDFTSISEGKKVFSKLKSFCLPGMSKLFCKDIVLITYNWKTLYKRAKK